MNTLAPYPPAPPVDFSGLTSVDATAKTDGYEPYWDGGGLVLKGSPPKQLDVRRKGAKGDVLTVTDGAILSGTNQLSSATVNGGAGFSNTFLDVGKAVQVRGAGAAVARGTGNTGGTTNTILAATGWWIPGMIVAGTGIPANTEVIKVDGVYGNQTLTLSANLNGAGGAGTALSIVGSLNAYVGSITGGVANLVTTAGGSTAANATTTVAGVKVRYGTDDTTAIAATYALAGLLGHDVYFSQGGYWCSTVTVNISKVRWRASKGATIYQLGGYNNPLFNRNTTTVGSSLTGVEFDGLTLDGDPTLTGATPSTAAIFLAGPGQEDITVRNCTFSKFLGTAANVYHGRNTKVLGNTARYVCSPAGWNAFNIIDNHIPTNGITQAATWPGTGTSIVDDNTVEHCATAGIDVVTNGQGPYAVRQRTSITNNQLRFCGWQGIACETNGGARGFTITGNGIYSCAGGISITNTNIGTFAPGYGDQQNGTIVGNTIDTEEIGGHAATGIQCYVSNTTIAGNTIRCPGTAIWVQGQSATSRVYNATIAANTIKVCNQDTASPQVVVVLTQTDGVKFSDNTIEVESEFDYLQITGATAGTFTLTVTDTGGPGTVWGPTAAIAFNATPAAVQAAIVAVLPAAYADAVVVTSGNSGLQNLPAGTLEVLFQRGLGGRAVTLAADFTGLTGATAPAVTRVVPGATSHIGFSATDTSRLSVTGNTLSYIGLTGIALTDGRDATITDNEIYDCNMRNVGGVSGAGIAHTGNAGSGVLIKGNKAVDRRPSARMTYGVFLAAGTSTGTPVDLIGNTLLGFTTADVNDRTLVRNERDTISDTTGTVKNNGLREGVGTAAPTTGTWAVGDRIRNKTPVVGQPKAWVCTVAGTPGTWVSEGNL